MAKQKSRMCAEDSEQIAGMYMLLKELSNKLGIDMRSLESQELKEEHSESSMKAAGISKRERKQIQKELSQL
jgi:hypothetical protein